MAAIFVANLIEYHREGFKPERDIIVALTTDEELAHSPHNGINWLLENERALIDAEFALNEGGGGALRNGRPFRLGDAARREGLPDLRAGGDRPRRALARRRAATTRSTGCRRR